MKTMKTIMAFVISISFMNAAEIASWEAGKGDVAGISANQGDKISLNTIISSTDSTPAKIIMKTMSNSVITMAPKTELSFSEKPKSLIIKITKGSAQFDIKGKANYSTVIVQGVTSEIEVIGTLFVVKVNENQKDLVAMIRGKAKVRMISEVAKQLGLLDLSEIELNDRQSISVSSTGLADVVALAERPQLVAAPKVQTKTGADVSADSAQAADPAVATDTAGSPAIENWDTDNAAVVLASAALEDVPVEDVIEEPVLEMSTDDISSQVQEQVIESITNEIIDEAVDEITTEIIDNATEALAPLPGHP